MSSGTDEDVSPGAIWYRAKLTISVHERRPDGTWGRCVHCPDVGPCGNLAWAWRQKLHREADARARLVALRLGEWPTTPQA